MIWKRLPIAIVAAALLSFGACSRAPVRPTHVIFISLDTARADHFGFMGSTKVATPGLDALSAESIVFTDYMTVAPTTLASHTSLFTGKYPHHHGTPRNGFMVNLQNDMLAEILKEAGYHTAGFAGSFALDARFDFAQGFDHYDQEFDIFARVDGTDQNQRRAEDVTDAVVSYLDRNGVPDRLFLFVHYFDPHSPYSAPPPFDTLYDPEGRDGLPEIKAIRKSPELTPPERERAASRMALQYDAEISYTDHHVGRLLEDLRSRGVLDDAIVVVTSDHGESMWEHEEEFTHGFFVYQSTMHALCLIRLPGGESGNTRVDGTVASIDLLPTVLERLGLPVPEGVDGEVIPLGRIDQGLPDRIRYGEATYPHRRVETDPRWTNMRKARCVREGPYKFIRTPYLGTAEIYDVLADPNEIRDMTRMRAAALVDTRRRLSEKLAAWSLSADPLPSHFDSSQQSETEARLRSLGYLR